LVLYEMFTGKRVFQANSLAELLRLHENMLLTSPAFLVKDLDPAIERLILSCLDPDPNNRPYSALAVSATLPGGDPLGAALAAGETPSPETVAAEGGLAGLSPRVAGWCMASVVIGLVAVAFLSTKVSLIEKGLLGRTPDVLVQKARDILQIIGYTYRPMDSAYGLRYDANPYFRYVEQHDLSSKRWSHLVAQQPPLIHFWYCQSPRYLDPSSLFTGSLGPMRVVSVAATVNAFDAAAVVPGLLRIKLDPLGSPHVSKRRALSSGKIARSVPALRLERTVHGGGAESRYVLTSTAAMDSSRCVRYPSSLDRNICGTTRFFAPCGGGRLEGQASLFSDHWPLE
jgi:hypothetical protein